MKKLALAVLTAVSFLASPCLRLHAEENKYPRVASWFSIDDGVAQSFFAYDPLLKDNAVVKALPTGGFADALAYILAFDGTHVAQRFGITEAEAALVKDRASSFGRSYLVDAHRAYAKASTVRALEGLDPTISFDSGPRRTSRRDEDDGRNNDYVHPDIQLLGGVGVAEARTYGRKDAAASLSPYMRQYPCNDSVVGGVQACGSSQHIRAASAGFIGRIPILAQKIDGKKSNHWGNVGADLGLVVTRYGAKDKGDGYILDRKVTPNGGLTPGDYHDDYNIAWRRGGATVVEFAGLNYQTPTVLKFLSAEVGTRLAGYSHDSRFHLDEAVDHVEFQGFVPCTDANGNPIPGSSCESWQTTRIAEREIDVKGTQSAGLALVPFASVSAAVAKRLAFKVEYAKPRIPGFNEKIYRAGLVVNW